MSLGSNTKAFGICAFVLTTKETVSSTNCENKTSENECQCNSETLCVLTMYMPTTRLVQWAESSCSLMNHPLLRPLGKNNTLLHRVFSDLYVVISKYPFVMVRAASDVFHLILSRTSSFHLTVYLSKIVVYLMRFSQLCQDLPLCFFSWGFKKKIIKKLNCDFSCAPHALSHIINW